MSQNLEVNTNLFRRGGVVGRKEYFKIMFIIFAVTILTFVIMANSFFKSEVMEVGFMGITLIILLGLSYFGLINSFKRLRDIRGTTYNEMPYQVGLAILLSVPYISLIPLAILIFAEGAVTGRGTAFARVERAFSNKIDEAASPVDLESKRIDNLSRLHQLKETGAITEDEYKHYKDDVLKKSA